jgi:hypothetical protein
MEEWYMLRERVAKVMQDRVQPLILFWEVLTLRGLVEADYLAIYVVGCPGF